MASCFLENTQHASVRRVHTSHAARDGSEDGVNVFLVAKVSVARMHTQKRIIKPFTLLFKLCHEVCQKSSDRKKKILATVGCGSFLPEPHKFWWFRPTGQKSHEREVLITLASKCIQGRRELHHI